MKPSNLLTTLILTILLFDAYAQKYVDLISVSHLHQLQNASGALPGESDYSATGLDLVLPIVINDNVAIIAGLFSEQTTISHQEKLCPTLYGTTLKLGASISHTDRFSATYVALPKLSGDFKHLDADQFQIGGIFLGKYKIHDQFNIRFGVYANREFFGPFIVPLAGIYLKKGRWEAKGGVPINAEIKNDIIIDQFAIGARFDGINRSYYLSAPTDLYVEKANNEIGLFAQYQRGNGILRVTAGQSAGRKLASYAPDDKVTLALPLYKVNNDRIEVGSIRPNGVYANLSFIYRLPID